MPNPGLDTTEFTLRLVAKFASKGLQPGAQTVALAAAIAECVIEELEQRANVNGLCPSGGGALTAGQIT